MTSGLAAAVGQFAQDVGFGGIGGRPKGGDESSLVAARLAAEGDNDGFVVGVGGSLESEEFDDLGLRRADPMPTAPAQDPRWIGGDVEVAREAPGPQEGKDLGDGQFVPGHGVRQDSQLSSAGNVIARIPDLFTGNLLWGR
jgi:hypothetical protein